MVAYTNVFTGSAISPADTSLTQLALTANVTLYWPMEAQPNVQLAADIIEITSASVAGLVVTLPDATRATTGTTLLIDNQSAQSVIFNNAAGNQVLSIAAGTQWQIYLTSNATAGGSWRVYQFGASTSTANAASLAGSGLVASGTTLNQAAPAVSFLYSFTATAADRAKFYAFVGTGVGTITLMPPATAGNGWFFMVRNSSVASLNITPPATILINGVSSLALQPGDSAQIICDGTSYYTVGLGQNAQMAFDYVVIDVTGSADYTLTGAELNRIAYQFIGTMGASFSVIVPPTLQQYWVFDNTNVGAFALAVKTSTQLTPVALTRGSRAILYCDGANVVPAITSSYSGAVDGGLF